MKKKTVADGIIDGPDTGVCIIDIDKIISFWDKDTFISRWHDDYRICSGTENKQVKFTISEETAKSLIEKLDLVKVKMKPFLWAWSYMTKEREARYNAAMKVPDLVMDVIACIMEKKQNLTKKETKQFYKTLLNYLRQKG
jgi:hypothetical protein